MLSACLSDAIAELSEAQIFTLSLFLFMLYKLSKGVSDILWWMANQDSGFSCLSCLRCTGTLGYGDFRLREPEEYYLRAMSEKLGFIELSSWALIKLLVGVLLSVFPELALCCLSQWCFESSKDRIPAQAAHQIASGTSCKALLSSILRRLALRIMKG